MRTLAGAGVPTCWKSGGPSRDQPLTHAPLPPAGVWPSPAQAGDWVFHQRDMEIEIALRLGQPVDAAQAALTAAIAAQVLATAQLAAAQTALTIMQIETMARRL